MKGNLGSKQAAPFAKGGGRSQNHPNNAKGEAKSMPPPKMKVKMQK